MQERSGKVGKNMGGKNIKLVTVMFPLDFNWNKNIKLQKNICNIL